MKEWNDDYKTGIEIIDADHKAFFDLVLLIHGGADDNVLVESIVGILEEYIDGHFYREEMAMVKAHYPHVREHKQQHERFRTEILETIQLFRGGNERAIVKLADTVTEWLVGHIGHDDQEYVAWIGPYLDTRPMVYLSIESVAHREKVQRQFNKTQPDFWHE